MTCSALLAAVFCALAEANKIRQVVCTERGTSFDIGSNRRCQSVVMDKRMADILGDASLFGEVGTSSGTVEADILATSKQELFHEGPVLFEDRKQIYFTTDRLGNKSGPDQHVDLMRYSLEDGSVVKVKTGIPMANGMTKDNDGESLIITSQGYGTTGGAIFKYNLNTMQTTMLVSSFWGQNLNSPNDVKMASNGDIYFTDPVYAFEQNFRSGHPELGNNVYRYEASSGTLSVLEDSLMRPNGLVLWEEADAVLVSDSAYLDAQGNPLNPHAIYSIALGEGAPKGYRKELLFVSPAGIQDGMALYRPGKLLFVGTSGGLAVRDLCTNHMIGFISTPNPDNANGGDATFSGVTQVLVPDKPGPGTIYGFSQTSMWSLKVNMPAISACETRTEGGDSRRLNSNPLIV